MNRDLRKELTRIKNDIYNGVDLSYSELAFLQGNKEAVMEYEDIRLAETAGITEEEWRRGYLLTDDEAICSWCGDIYNKSDLQEELNLGLLCDRCIRAIKSRGETLVFEE